jgi:protein MpaA
VLRGLIVASLVAAGLASAAPQSRQALVIGHSVRGRPIVAYERGDRSAPATVVVGVIHGTEPAGLAVIARLRRMPLAPGVHLWLVPTVNPDGLAAGTRQNAQGVDLNRNWPAAWVHNGRPWDGYYSGPRPMSEPENRAMRAFLLRVRPKLTIWYHQPQTLVRAWGQSVPAARKFARFSNMDFAKIRWPHGTAPNWQNHRFPGDASFVVELPAGPLPGRAAARYAEAVRRLPQ